MLRLSLRQQQKKQSSPNLSQAARWPLGQHGLSVPVLLPIRWYLMLSAVIHILVFAIGFLYLALMPPPAAKQLPLALSLVNLPSSPESPDVEVPAQVAELMPEPISHEVIKPVYVSQVSKKTRLKQDLPEKVERPEKAEQKFEDDLISYYPDAYVAKRLTGDVLLRLSVESGTGKVLAIRIERPSPHGLFNDAAKEAVMALMPKVNSDLPAEVLLPVRFRLSR